MSSREEQLKVKASLKFTWGPFFSRFGRFTPIQVAAIPSVLDGRDCLLASRTASGKTEAAMAPLAERLKEGGWEGLSVVYVSPTRALVNDLFRRLEPRLTEMGISVNARTSDSPYFNHSEPPSIVITTPESFDSLLSRCPRSFLGVRAVVLDEIHLLDGQARGDQLRLLLHRLRALKSNAFERGETTAAGFQTVALSATLDDPSDVAARYCLAPEVIRVEGKRKLDHELVPMTDSAVLHRLVASFRRRGIRKALVFCRSRAECERQAAALRRWPEGTARGAGNPFGDNVFVHHASLDRSLRASVEQRLGQEEVGICFATSTLELGVDIGDIDVVLLVGPPYSIGSFLQRIGRGNRRTNVTRVIGLYRTSREQALFNLLIAAAEAGWQDENVYSFRPSVMVQQILSYLKQTPEGALTSRHLRVLLDDSGSGQTLLDAEAERALIEYLIEEAVLLRSSRGGELRPGEKGRELYEKHQQFSNIEAVRQSLTVVDDFTGRVVGEILKQNLKLDETFLFGANRLGVVRLDDGRVNVRVDNGGEPSRGINFRSRSHPLPFDLARRLGEYAGVTPGVFPAFYDGDRWYVMHALGDAYGQILASLMQEEKGWKARSEGMTLRAVDAPPDTVIAVDEGQVAKLVRKRYQGLEAMLAMGKFQGFLPTALRQASVIAAFAPARFCRAVNGRRIIPVSDHEQITKLRQMK